MNRSEPSTIRPVSSAATVLYVDDEEMARKYFERTFSGQYTVLTAADADSAMKMLQDPHLRIGIVVSDYRMPGRTGGDLLRQIARELPHIVRILVTAYADRDVLLDTANAGEVFRIMEKPLDAAQVAKTLGLASDLLSTRNARQQRLQAIDETLSFLAHELNTPLAAILNFSQGMQDRLSGSTVSAAQQAQVYSALSSVVDNARYCMAVLGSFVETVREADSHAPLPAATSAHELVRSFLDSYPLSADQRRIIRIEVANDFEITTLPNCVSLVLSSLLGNSLRALEGRPNPEIRLVISANDLPRICIADNGPGILPEVQAQLDADPVTSPPCPEDTSGLLFSKRIMQAFGGSLTIQAEPERCTAVCLHFPPADRERSGNDKA